MPEPTLISVFLRKLSVFDSPIVRRLLEIAAVLALIWLAAMAKEKGPKELDVIVTLILGFGPILVVFQCVLLVITIVASGAKEIRDLNQTANPVNLEKTNDDKPGGNMPRT